MLSASKHKNGSHLGRYVDLLVSGSWLMQPYIIVGVTQHNKVVGKNIV